MIVGANIDAVQLKEKEIKETVNTRLRMMLTVRGGRDRDEKGNEVPWRLLTRPLGYLGGAGLEGIYYIVKNNSINK